ncbi:MAG: flagellar FliJ family protein [Deltaproteobacteria bacterium]|nr:flagellar FliJ family protein [Deltaproteobacteria bacterium]
MTPGDLEKLKRLIAFRERQRDRAVADMEEAHRQENEALEQRNEAEQTLNEELQIFRDAVGETVNPLDLELAVECAKWAQISLQKKEKNLIQKHQQTDIQRDKLLESHKKVKQMETLHKQRKQEKQREEQHAQQAELDDLAAIREVHQ